MNTSLIAHFLIRFFTPATKFIFYFRMIAQLNPFLRLLRRPQNFFKNKFKLFSDCTWMHPKEERDGEWRYQHDLSTEVG